MNHSSLYLITSNMYSPRGLVSSSPPSGFEEDTMSSTTTSSSGDERETLSTLPKHLRAPLPLTPLPSQTINQVPSIESPPTPLDSSSPSPSSSLCPNCNSPHCNLCLRCSRVTAPIVLFSLLSIIFLALGRGYLTQLLAWLEHLPLAYSLAVFVLLFTIISFPFGFGYIILNMTAGYLYGLTRGQVVVTLAVAIGFSVAFLSCRSCLRDWASQYIATTPALLAVTKVVEGPHGLKVIFLTRLTPFPFGIQNAMFAITNVSFTKVLIGSTLGLFPTQILNTYMGSTVRNMKEVLSDRADGYIILTAQIIVSVVLSLYLVHKAKQELNKLAAKPSNDVEKGLGPLTTNR